MEVTRRGLFAGSLAAAFMGKAADSATAERARDVPVSGEADLIVAGGGPAGISAAITAARLDNLYMAGRCISGDFLSQASYRVTGPAVEMAEGVVRRLFR